MLSFVGNLAEEWYKCRAITIITVMVLKMVSQLS